MTIMGPTCLPCQQGLPRLGCGPKRRLPHNHIMPSLQLFQLFTALALLAPFAFFGVGLFAWAWWVVAALFVLGLVMRLLFGVLPRRNNG